VENLIARLIREERRIIAEEKAVAFKATLRRLYEKNT